MKITMTELKTEQKALATDFIKQKKDSVTCKTEYLRESKGQQNENYRI
jgi:hypothetical protein